MPEICVSIEALKVGDLVIRIEESTGYRLKKSGRIQSPQDILALRSAGVSSVWIEPRTEQKEEAPAPDTSAASEEAPAVSGSVAKSRTFYAKARDQMADFYSLVSDGGIPDVEVAQQYASTFVDGALKHPTTLSCLTRIREKDAYLMEHSLNVCILMAIFANHLGIARETIDKLALGALLHDLGKVMVPETILMKPGKLTDAEFEVMKSHVVHSAAILAEEKDLPPEVMDVVANHHERIDGNGYPKGKSGEEVSMYARMVSIVDVYDALTAERCYKEAMAPTKAMRLLMELAGSHFDDNLVRQFVRCMGVYPVGSLVRLKSGRLAVVVELNPESALRPKLKVVYSIASHSHLPVQNLNLLFSSDSIEKAEDPSEWSIDVARYLL
ncbi:HD-GYP domain-containing protein [Gallaecimonas pentaromativorans]|uniref:HD-GYP domain-containing protein n=1 Tax=Gallaecimonas pentaromativorans TaxID=584787 RepID=UPI003A8E8EBD